MTRLQLLAAVCLVLSLATFVIGQSNGRPSESGRCGTEAIQNASALQQAVQDLKANDILCVAAKDITLKKTLIIEVENVTIRGQGQGKTTLRCHEVKGPALTVKGNNSRIESVTVTGCDDESAVVVDIADGNETNRISFSKVDFHENGESNTTLIGGALRIINCTTQDCKPTVVSIDSCSFKSNRAILGGAIFGNGSHLDILNTTFIKNHASRAGGAIYLEYGGSRLIIKSSSFSNNKVTREFPSGLRFRSEESICEEDIKRCGGGAIFADSIDHLTLSMSNLTNNAVCGTGGAISMRSVGSDDGARWKRKTRIEGCKFRSNAANCRRASGQKALLAANGYLGSGGGIFAWSDKANQEVIQIKSSNFTKNQGVHGGGMFLEGGPSPKPHDITSCNFKDNYGQVHGGGLFVGNTDVQLRGGSFVKNRGFSGGGICLVHQASITVEPDDENKQFTRFHRNIALTGAGMEVLEGASAVIVSAIFSNNTGLRYGGGVHVRNTKGHLGFFGVTFQNNTSIIGAGLAISGSRNVTIAGSGSKMTIFWNNSALVGGGLYYKPGHRQAARFLIENVQFSKNKVFDADDEYVNNQFARYNRTDEFLEIISPILKHFPGKYVLRFLLRNLTSTRSGTGGGFCLELKDANAFTIREIMFTNVTALENEALVGGGGSLHTTKAFWNSAKQQSCFPVFLDDDLCQKLIFQNVNITGNKALYAGGLFVTTPKSVMLTCDRGKEKNNNTLLDVMRRRLNSTNDEHLSRSAELFCSNIAGNMLTVRNSLVHDISLISTGCVQNTNSASGADIGSKVVFLEIQDQTDQLKEVASGESLRLPCRDVQNSTCSRPLTVLVQDAFNQTIERGIRDAELEVTLRSDNIVGEVRYTAKNGTMEITKTKAWGINVMSNLTIHATFDRSITITVKFSTRACLIGEYIVGNLCKKCPADQYSFNSTSDSCVPCEEDAACKGGAVLVPIDGYWHSTPFSPQFHHCFIDEACKYENRIGNLTEFYQDSEELQKELDELKAYVDDRSKTKPKFSEYEQCSEGYKGVLCGSCEDGYGHSANGECLKCPGNLTLTLILLLLQFVWLTILIGSNAAVILRSTTTRIQLAFFRRDEAPSTSLRGIPRVNRHVSERIIGEILRQNQIAEEYLATTDASILNLMDQRLTASIQLSETIKIVVNYLQIVSMAVNIPVHWEKVLSGFLDLQSSAATPSIDGVLSNTECFAHEMGFNDSTIVVLWMKILTPTVVMFCVLSLYTCAWSYVKSTVRDARAEELDQMVSTSWTVGATVIVASAIFMSFVETTQGFLKALNCVHVDEKVEKDDVHSYGSYSIEDTDKVWVEDTFYQCFHGEHRLTGYAGLGGVILSIVVIALTFFWIPLNRGKTKNIKFIARYSFLYQGYKENWYTAPWEAMILLRKAALVSVVVFAYRLGPGLQASLAIGILLIALALQNAFVPFKVVPSHRPVPLYFRKCFGRYAYSRAVAGFLHICNVLTMNALEASSLFCSAAVFFTALIVNDDKASTAPKDILAVFVFIINVLFLLFAVFRIYAGIHVYLDSELKFANPEVVTASDESPRPISLVIKGTRFVWLLCQDYVESLVNTMTHVSRMAINPALQALLPTSNGRSHADFGEESPL